MHHHFRRIEIQLHHHQFVISQLLYGLIHQIYKIPSINKYHFRFFPFQPPSTDNSGAPAVPPRVSSIRNSNGAQMTIVQQQTNSTAGMSSSARTVTRFVVDLDARFGAAFHNVTEFPAPSPFTNFEKSYASKSSQNIKATTGMF